MTQGISTSLNLTLARLNSIENNFAALERISAQLNGVTQNQTIENKDFQTILNEKLNKTSQENKIEKTLEENRSKALEQGLINLQFVGYEGMKFPFEDRFFDVVVTRYALHHFPAIHDTFHEIHRVLKPNGTFFLSDPSPNDDDTERFVDEYMQMKKDGHIRFYTKQEWVEIGTEASLQFIDGFETVIRFPRKRETAFGFDEIVSRHDKNVINGYKVEVTDDEIWITEKVNNLLYREGTK